MNARSRFCCLLPNITHLEHPPPHTHTHKTELLPAGVMYPPVGDSSSAGLSRPLVAVATTADTRPACCTSRLAALLPPNASSAATRATGPSNRPALHSSKQKHHHHKRSAGMTDTASNDKAPLQSQWPLLISLHIGQAWSLKRYQALLSARAMLPMTQNHMLCFLHKRGAATEQGLKHPSSCVSPASNPLHSL